MIVLSFHNLDSALQAIVTHFINTYNPNALLYDMMYLTGCRYVEANELCRWELINGGYYKLTTAKEGEYRTFETYMLPVRFKTLVNAGIEYCSTHSYRTAVRDFYAASPYRMLKVGNKPIALHAFRHNYVKRLMSLGYPPAEIQAKLGHKDIGNTMKYINSVIYY